MDEEFHAKCKKDFHKATHGQSTMDLAQFMQSTSCRSRYYSVAIFDVIDTTKQSVITFEDFFHLRKLLAFGSVEEKASFAFTLLDADKDGLLSENDLAVGLEASVIESERTLPAGESEVLLETLMRIFTDGKGGPISLERFIEVLRSYPDLLGAFTIGSLEASENIAAKNTYWSKFVRSVKKLKKWIVNKPARFATYIVTSLVVVAAFFWQFWKFSGDCSRVDLEFVDPVTGVSRQEIQNLAANVFGVSITDEEAQYMSFSSAMSDNDSLRCRDARIRMLMSWTLPIAKGSGRAMKVIFTLILFPVSRSLMTRLRDTFLRHVFDFDGAISYHKYKFEVLFFPLLSCFCMFRILGTFGFLLAWIHTLSHLKHIHRKQNPSLYKEWVFAYPSDEENRSFSVGEVTSETPHIDGVPMDLLKGSPDQPDAVGVLQYPVILTGFALTLIFTVAALYALDYPKHLKFFNLSPSDLKNASWSKKLRAAIGKHLNDFNSFWYTHHLFVLFYIILVFHPFPSSSLDSEHAMTEAWVWVLVPVLLYTAERMHRAIQHADCTPLIEVIALPGRVLAMKTAKPERLDYKAGQYVMINCNRVSRFEWHPFTLTSAPQDPFLSVHMRAVGDWTNAMYDALKDCSPAKQELVDLETGTSSGRQQFNRSPTTTLKIAGPYGAPSQKYDDYRVVVCVGAGIGITPFASILSNVLHSIRSTKNHKARKVYFHWVVRSRCEASWFSSLLDEIAVDDEDGILSITIHITSMKHASDVRLMLLKLAEFEKTHSDCSGRMVCKSIIKFGRPNWHQVLYKYKQDHNDESKIGVFYCGPNALKRALKGQCESLTSSSQKFVFSKEIF
eukprot:g2309.t1